MAPGHPNSVLQAILDWSATRPLWLRDALRRVIQQSTVTEADCSDLARLCRAERGLKETGNPAVPLDASHLPSNPPVGQAVTLISISEPTSVNQLAEKQSLTFGPSGLTVIYGDNGSGKSGYSRVLKRACRARSRGEPIQPNAYKPSVHTAASAKIAFRVGAQLQTLEWQDKPEAVPAELSAVSVFDSECAAVQVENKNEVAFRPFGLDIPDKLASTCQDVKGILQEERTRLDANRSAVWQKPTWSQSSRAGKALSALRHNTDYTSLVALAELSEKDKQRLLQLREDLAKDPAAAAKELRLRCSRFRTLLDQLKAAEEAISDHTLSTLASVVSDAEAKRDAAKFAAQELFAGEPLSGVGTDVWRQLWDSARAYSEGVAYKGKIFPAVGEADHCVLCQQPLGQEASNRLRRFEDFVKADTEQRAHEAAVRAQEGLLALVHANLGEHAAGAKGIVSELELHEAELAAGVRLFLNAADDRREIFNTSHANKTAPSYPPLPTCPTEALAAVIQRAETRATELELAAAGADRKKLENELQELVDREVLRSLLPDAEKEIQRLQRAQALDQCIAAAGTTAITALGNQLAEEVLTPHLRDRFNDELIQLADNRVRVELVYAGGRYGSPQYQVALIARPRANVAQILSEGEQKCVALAGFFAELTTASHRSALVFDDPVSSLDHKWRSKVADRLVKEAATRQTIVFTHDLVFVHDLIDEARGQSVECNLRSLSRDVDATGYVSNGLPWVGMKVEARIDELEKQTRGAQGVYDAGDEAAYTREARCIYDGLRATWERALEEIAFGRVIVRYRDYIDQKDLKKVSVFTEQDAELFRQNFHKCSNQVTGHDPSLARNPSVPRPSEILQDVKILKDWVIDLRNRQKALK